MSDSQLMPELESCVEPRKICRIIGVHDNGRDGLDPIALSYIGKADVVIGAHRTLSLFKDIIKRDAQQRDLNSQLKHIPEWIRTAQKAEQSVVVLATGDPLCHGIAKYLVEKLGIVECEIIPNTSMVQLACARLGIAWQNVHICSVHAEDAGEWDHAADHQHGLYSVLQDCQRYELLAIFTSPDNTPDRIARMLKHENLTEDFRLSVAAQLLSDKEQIHRSLDINDAARMHFFEPNIVILQAEKPMKHSPLFGLEDSTYIQRKPDKGLISKREVRAVSLARLQLKRNSIIWDIGSGSGSIGLEAAQLCVQGYVYAIEKNLADAEIIQQNQSHLDIHNFKVFHARAPQCLARWPNPDAVFIGGSGGELSTLITLCLQRLKPQGMLVMNFVTLENLSTASETLKQLGADWDVVQLQASRSQPILHMHRLRAENPVWIVCAKIKKQADE